MGGTWFDLGICIKWHSVGIVEYLHLAPVLGAVPQTLYKKSRNRGFEMDPSTASMKRSRKKIKLSSCHPLLNAASNNPLPKTTHAKNKNTIALCTHPTSSFLPIMHPTATIAKTRLAATPIMTPASTVNSAFLRPVVSRMAATKSRMIEAVKDAKQERKRNVSLARAAADCGREGKVE